MPTKQCPRCNNTLSSELFYFKKGIIDTYCKQCRLQLNSEQQRKKPRTDGARRIASVKDKVIAAYGGKCCSCGESCRAFLTLDHVNGGGSMHRRSTRNDGHYVDAVRRGYPEDYQVLCYNCNCVKAYRTGCVAKNGILVYIDDVTASASCYRYRELKNIVISFYGCKCVCCGTTRREVLTLDHVNRGGSKHRKLGANIHYKDALRRNFPPDYRVLCFNCNCVQAHGKPCPHTLS